MAVEDIGARRLAGLIPDRYRDRLGLASSINPCAQRGRPSHEATRRLAVSRDLKPFHDLHTTLELDEPVISNRNLRAPKGGTVLASNPVRNDPDR
jgi:hypothetical protein